MLLRFDPFREFDRMTDSFSRTSPSMPMDAVRRDDKVVVWLDLPGVDADSIDLEVERNVVTVKAERRYQAAEGEQVLARERTHGSFSRQLLLGDSLDADAVEANYADGVLELSVPVAEKAKPRKVSVGAGTGRQAIEADSTES
ncbi:MAG: Hsp20/alpha crystallin family protein [Actinomycetota bacterium]